MKPPLSPSTAATLSERYRMLSTLYRMPLPIGRLLLDINRLSRKCSDPTASCCMHSRLDCAVTARLKLTRYRFVVLGPGDLLQRAPSNRVRPSRAEVAPDSSRGAAGNAC